MTRLGVAAVGRWALNHGSPTSTVLVYQRISISLEQLDRLASKMAPSAGDNSIRIQNVKRKSNKKERDAWQCYRFIQEDLARLYTLIRGAADDLTRHVIKPCLYKHTGHRVRNSFADLFKGPYKARPEFRSAVGQFFRAIRINHAIFCKEIRYPRDQLVHYGAQIVLRKADGSWCYAFRNGKEVLEEPDDENAEWIPVKRLQELLDLTAAIFETTFEELLRLENQ
ncbi:hypothetical protein ACFL51_01480 [Myxococcota bacterium]